MSSGARWAFLLVGQVLLSSGSLAREVDFNRGWRFTTGDPRGAHQINFDDATWSVVRTPHDAAIAGPFDPKLDGSTGKLPWRGVGWYRKWIALNRQEEGSRVYLDFDGVMAAAEVYLNGKLAFTGDYGYTPFRVDVTPFARFGRSNVVAVRYDTTKMQSRWYPGAGIYRKVTLRVEPPMHLARHGLVVLTDSLTESGAAIRALCEVENHLGVACDGEVRVRVFDPQGKEVGSETRAITVGEAAVGIAELQLSLPAPQRWDTTSPRLYRAEAALSVGGQVVHRADATFGLRTFRFDPNEGFWLNGRRVELRGANLHHDLGPLGAAFNVAAAERQLVLLKSMGVNAIRTAHNPPASDLLDLCDRHGLLVWNELFDKWNETAGRFEGLPSFEEHGRRHVERFVRRDRNHPCIVVWSVGNEILNQPYDPEGKSRPRLATLRDEVLRHDATRPVGLGCFIPETARTDILADLDLTGWNYQRRYALFRENFPAKPIVYSESASAVSSRGQYLLPLPDAKCDYSSTQQVSAFELSAAPWADLAEVEFDLMRRDRFVAGEFVWSGFDYLGEPTPFPESARSSYFGVLDLVGLPKDRFYLYRSYWNSDAPTVHLAPHWNWPGREGEPIPVFGYTNGDSGELFLNGRSLGVRRKGDPPPRPRDRAVGAVATASSQADGAAPSRALGSVSGAWRAAPGDGLPTISVTLSEALENPCVVLEFPGLSKLYGYDLEASDASGVWRKVASHPATTQPEWGGVSDSVHRLAGRIDRLRLRFTECLEDTTPAVERLAVYTEPYESPYYRPTYDYRLRWDAVPYEPGELRLVAYRAGQRVGETVVKTSGPPAQVRLEVDRAAIRNDGEDLAFVTLTAVDREGLPCPTADNLVALRVTGPGVLVAADAGDPLSLDPLQDDRVRLFAGKAVAIVRFNESAAGTLRLEAAGEGLEPGAIEIGTGEEPVPSR